MRTVGNRRPVAISFHASATLLAEGALFNDEIQRLPTGGVGFVPKGLYRFQSYEAAIRFDLECLAKDMPSIARDSR